MPRCRLRKRKINLFTYTNTRTHTHIHTHRHTHTHTHKHINTHQIKAEKEELKARLLETEEAAEGNNVTCLQLRTELEETKAANEILASEVHKIKKFKYIGNKRK